jgi:hypothetical protein
VPLGDEKHTLIFNELVNILGNDYVEDDPAIMEAFYRDGLTPQFMSRGRAEFIVLPENTGDIQQILKLANRYHFPFSITSTGLNTQSCNAVEGMPYWCIIDPKRMDQLEIDVDNMYAIVEPYVTIAQLQAEAMKHGLFCGVPGASSQASVLAGNVFQSIQWTGWRTGVGRSVLGVEWILPSGDILRTGSLAIPGAGYCWGEGPGPDGRGLLRGHVGHLGALGVVTKMAVKLYLWPGPKIWPTEGVQPEKISVLPKDKIKSYFISFPTLKKSIDAVREMGKAEIAGLVMKFTPWDFVCWATKSFEEFWEVWGSEFWEKQRKSGHMVWVELWGFTSEKQLKYEEKVLQKIIAENKGELVPDDVHRWLDHGLTPNAVRDTHRNRFTRMGGRIMVTGATMDSLYDVLRSAQIDLPLRDRYTPPLGEMGNSIKFWPFDFGRLAWTEADSIAEKSNEFEEMMQKELAPDMVKTALQNLAAPTVTVGAIAQLGSQFGNIHILLGEIKNALDPNNIANPTRLINMSELEKRGVTFKPPI